MSPRYEDMRSESYRLLLDFLMSDDPVTIPRETRDDLVDTANLVAQRRGYRDWAHAYHLHQKGHA